MTASNAIKKFVCMIAGHKPVESQLKRSPYTAHTHSTDTHCGRCGKLLYWKKHYIDAISQPEYFMDGYEKLPIPRRTVDR